MQSDKITLYSLEFTDTRSYLLTAGFVAGNIILPQLCHLVNQGGAILLPIYLFTLIGAYKYGWRVGLLTAILSPLANHLLFGMPPVAVLPIILIKSTLLALAAGVAARRLHHLPLLVTLAMVVACYQVLGTLAEWAIVGDLYTALQDFRLGVAGMLIQIFGGEFIIRRLPSKRD